MSLASLLSSPLPPSSSSLFFVLLSPYFCWQSSFRPLLQLWSLVNSCPLPSWFSGLCFYSELCHELLECPGTSPVPLVPHSWSCCLSGWVWCPSLWAVLEVTREHLITSTVAVSLCLFQLPAATADRTRQYFLIFLAVQKKYLSFFWRPWFLLCSEPSLLYTAHRTGVLLCPFLEGDVCPHSHLAGATSEQEVPGATAAAPLQLLGFPLPDRITAHMVSGRKALAIKS